MQTPDRPQSSEKAGHLLGDAYFFAKDVGCDNARTEHLLAAILNDWDNLAVAALEDLGVDFKELRRQLVLPMVPSEPSHPHVSPWDGESVPWDTSMKEAVHLAFEEAREHEDDTVESIHLLIGLLREQNGVAGRVLREEGVDLQEVRARARLLLRGYRADPETSE